MHTLTLVLLIVTLGLHGLALVLAIRFALR